MEDALVDWDNPDDPNGNTAHIAEHGLTREEVESVLLNSASGDDTSASTGRLARFGATYTGRFIIVVYEILNIDDPLIVRPTTSYEVPE